MIKPSAFLLLPTTVALGLGLAKENVCYTGRRCEEGGTLTTYVRGVLDTIRVLQL